MKRSAIATLVVVSIFGLAEAATPTKFTKSPALAKSAGGKVLIEFAVDSATDVEVAILDTKGTVVRHLAAGMLGGTNVPPPLKAGLAQSLEWDGNDDYGVPVPAEALRDGGSVRVRTGMGIRLDQIVGGDPYAYYSSEMGWGDHATWCMTGLDAKSDGKVYVLGNACNIGPPALRQYDAEGNYLKTVFPPPAGLPADKVEGWGITARPNGEYAYKYKDLSSPKLSTTLICGVRAAIADLIPSPEPAKLMLANNHALMTINTDGTIAPDAMGQGFGQGYLVENPSMYHPERNRYKTPWELQGSAFTCPSPDGKSFYLSGLYAGTIQKTRCIGAEKTGFWRDGQVYKVSLPDHIATPFFALDADSVITTHKDREASPIGDTRSNPYAALHGVAADKNGNVFVCDRQNKRILVLDSTAKIMRQIPVAYPDAIALNPESRAIYVTTRNGNYHRKGEIRLLKFNDWSKDETPSVSMPLVAEAGMYPQRTYLCAVESRGKTLLWVGYTTLPIRIYEDNGSNMNLVKDFYRVSYQRCLDLQRIVVDPKTENVYVADGFKKGFILRDWKNPKFERCMVDGKTPLVSLSVAIDNRNRLLYTHDYMRDGVPKHSIARYRMDGEYFTPAPVGKTGNNGISGQRVSSDWRIGAGNTQRGIAVGPDGCVAALGSTEHTDYTGPLWIFQFNAETIPWKAMNIPCFGEKPQSGGIRFDPAGNLYAGMLIKGQNEGGKIYKFRPTGSLRSGCLYPTPPASPDKIYDKIGYGYAPPESTRTPLFGVDGYGRIYYPKTLLSKVGVMDNEGNSILEFGTYGNRDSMGGLDGDLVPTKDIPMAFPNSVDATDDYIYVSDMVNLRLIRLAKTFILDASVRM